MWPIWRPNSNRSKYVLFDDDDGIAGNNEQSNQNEAEKIHAKQSYKSMADKLDYFHRYYQSFESSVEDEQPYVHAESNIDNREQQQHCALSSSSLPAVQILNNDNNDHLTKANKFLKSSFDQPTDESTFTNSTGIFITMADPVTSNIGVAADKAKPTTNKCKCSPATMLSLIILLFFMFLLFIVSYGLIDNFINCGHRQV